MSYSAEQITEKGKQPKSKSKSGYNKKFQHRRMRQKMKNLDFTPHYKKYEAGWVM